MTPLNNTGDASQSGFDGILRLDFDVLIVTIDKMMAREPTLRDCLSTNDPYSDFFAKDPLHHIMDTHSLHMNASVCPIGSSSKKLCETEASPFQCGGSPSLFELPHANPVNVLLYDMPPMRMYASSSRNELEVNTSQLPTVFAIPSTTYLPSSHSPIDYLPNCYSPPPQDPAYHAKNSVQHFTTQNSQKSKKRIQAVPCHSNSICANCKTTETTLWRRAKTGEIECNACNLYFRKNNTKRPMSLCKDTIMKRNRKPRVDGTTVPKQMSSSGSNNGISSG
ncbi:hypothetical protein Q1695_000540 [Nippostrongylus brasiliensis]|nr:hypothetical protein Q1695_000540 [Nippostrongylus brasiliensis]